MDRKKSRLFIHNELVKVLTRTHPDAEKRVFFNPDSNTKLAYPCIIYKEQTYNARRADNLRYFSSIEYQITIIDRDPDTSIHENILDHFEHSRYSNNFRSDNLIHHILTIENWRTK